MKYKLIFFLIVVMLYPLDAHSQASLLKLLKPAKSTPVPKPPREIPYPSTNYPTPGYPKRKDPTIPSNTNSDKEKYEIGDFAKSVERGTQIPPIDIKSEIPPVKESKKVKRKISNLIRSPYYPLEGQYEPDKFTELALLVSIPQYSKEYKNIFDTYNDSDFEELGNISLYISGTPNPDVKIVKSKEMFLNDLKEKIEKKPVVLIGHNDTGKFIFPDGTFIKFEEIDAEIKSSKNPIIYLSCNSKKFTNNIGVNFKLNYMEAMILAQDLNKSLLKNDEFDNNNLDELFNQTIEEFLKNSKIIQNFEIIDYVVLIGGTGYIIYELRFK